MALHLLGTDSAFNDHFQFEAENVEELVGASAVVARAEQRVVTEEATLEAVQGRKGPPNWARLVPINSDKGFRSVHIILSLFTISAEMNVKKT